MGTGLIDLKILSIGPNSFSIVFLTVTQDSALTSSRHFLHSAIRGSGNIPSAAEINCASLIYVGPKRSAASRTLLYRRFFSVSSSLRAPRVVPTDQSGAETNGLRPSPALHKPGK